jgi:hypothetical protein
MILKSAYNVFASNEDLKTTVVNQCYFICLEDLKSMRKGKLMMKSVFKA